MSLLFEWDIKKSQSNSVKHGIDFEEAKTVFNDPFALTIGDPDHSTEEDRYLDLGLSNQGRLLVVSYTERSPRIRIISARKASTREAKDYEKNRT